MAVDLVSEAPFCAVCRRSSTVKWRKHVFSRSHQQKAQQFILSQAARLQEVCDAVTSWWRCVFCDEAGDNSDVVAHFSCEKHKRHVEEFCRRNRCDADRQTRHHLWLQPARRRELEAAIKTRDTSVQEAQQEEPKSGHLEANECVEAFLTSAVARLQEVQADRKRAVSVVENTTREQHEMLLGPQMTDSTRCKTVTSVDGVLQNPLGEHEGKRVWGGGIVKLRKTEWIPWAIDQLVKEEQVETQQSGTESAVFVHRETDLARGAGLNSIASVSWSGSVGNVHTSAVPPWMVQTEEEYKKCNRREQTTRQASNTKGDKKRRDIFSKLESKANYGPDWLPNFGGVWQEGPRSKTKYAFRKAAADRAPRRMTEEVAGTLPNQCVLCVKPLVPPQPTPPLQPLSLQQPAEKLPSLTEERKMVLPLKPPEVRVDESKSTNLLDAKKQLLAAQKERLRAKMAATCKRRQ